MNSELPESAKLVAVEPADAAVYIDVDVPELDRVLELLRTACQYQAVPCVGIRERLDEIYRLESIFRGISGNIVGAEIEVEGTITGRAREAKLIVHPSECLLKYVLTGRALDGA